MICSDYVFVCPFIVSCCCCRHKLVFYVSVCCGDLFFGVYVSLNFLFPTQSVHSFPKIVHDCVMMSHRSLQNW